MPADPVIDRGEAVAMLFTIHDMLFTLERILELLEEEFGGGAEVPEDDA